MLKIAIVHYHLHTGGVTRVIENAVDSLKDKDIQYCVLAGEPYEGSLLSNTHSIEGLGYSSEGDNYKAEDLCRQMIDSAKQLLGSEPDIWHIHNHSLGKNHHMPDICSMLAKRDAALFLQIHDFAEDGRPANYKILQESESDELSAYPVADHIHYSVLNTRDFDYLKSASIPESHLHLLPNSISAYDVPESVERPSELQADQFILNPTRAIRRKNIGEIALHAALADSGTLFATTLEPANPVAKKYHDRWVEFCGENKLPMKFAVGQSTPLSFPELIATADSIITTSIAEGFGLAFLEPWLMKKALCGRNISDITSDFSDKGINLNDLYERLEVPIEVIGEERLREELSKALSIFYKSYNIPLPDNATDEAYHSIVINEHADFGSLSEPLQERVIEAVLKSTDLKNSIGKQKLKTASETRIAENAKAVTENYNQQAYGERLYNIYKNIITSNKSSARSYLPSTQVLKQFLLPKRFNLLRT